MVIFSDFKIGLNNEPIELSSFDENREVALMFAQQARRSMIIISRLFDPQIYNTPEFIEAMRRMVTKNRSPKIRIIVFEPELIVRNGHRMVELAGTLSSFIEIRKASREFHTYNESLLVVDNKAYMHRINGERYEADVNFNDRRQCKAYTDEFETMWSSALPDPNLRRIAL